MQDSLLQSAIFSSFFFFFLNDKSYSFASVETAVNQRLDKHSAVRDQAKWRQSESMKWKEAEGNSAYISRKLH